MVHCNVFQKSICSWIETVQDCRILTSPSVMRSFRPFRHNFVLSATCKGDEDCRTSDDYKFPFNKIGFGYHTVAQSTQRKLFSGERFNNDFCDNWDLVGNTVEFDGDDVQIQIQKKCSSLQKVLFYSIDELGPGVNFYLFSTVFDYL